jgi:TIR domain-containing protein
MRHNRNVTDPGAVGTASRSVDKPIFVSHSSHEPFAEMVREATCRLLRDKGHDVWVNTDGLRPGDEWRGVITHQLAECRGAVLLLSRAALGSAWVRREVTILMWRRLLGSRVHVVPALLGDVTPDDVMAAGLTELRPLQAAMIGAETGTGQDAEEFARQIVDRFAAVPATVSDNDQIRQWTQRVSYFLTHVGDPDLLSECARRLGVTERDLPLVRLPEGNRFLAHQLLDDGLQRRTYDAIRVICDVMGAEWLSKLVSDVAFTWVDSGAARQLLLAAQRDAPATALLNARRSQTADEYLDRATCRGHYWREVAGMPVGEDTVAELVDHYERAVHDLHGFEPPYTADDLEGREGPMFLVIDPAGVPIDAVTEAVGILHAHYPYVTVLLLTGGQQTEIDRLCLEQPGSGLVPLPELAPGEEQRARRTVRDLRALQQR